MSNTQVEDNSQTPTYIYAVIPINVHKKDDVDLHNEFEIEKIKHPNWNSKSYEDFVKFLTSWGQKKYSFSSFTSSYHLDLNEAIEYATKNVADINECGAYPYVAVRTTPVGAAYYNVYLNPMTDILLYKYDREKDEYIPFTKDENKDLFMHMLYHIADLVYNKDTDEE